MYRAPSKKRQLLMRIGVYSAMTTGVILLVTFLVFIMLGYRFNRDTSSIQQGGLVQFASRPIDASVTVGSAKLTDLTPSKITMNPGNYDVKMSRQNYKDWSKNVDVTSGEVLWLNYAQLVPNNITTDQLTKFESVAGVKVSPNGDRFAVLTDASKPVVTFVDITGDTPKQTTITLPADILPADKTPTFELLEWANDSDRMLLNMTYDAVVERIVVDRREVERTVNVSKKYQADITQVTFDTRSSERLIIRSAAGEVRTIDTSNDSLSSVIASSVTSMTLFANDAILLVQTVPAGGQSVGYVSLGSNEVRVIKQVPSADKTLISIAKYFSEPYVAISTGSQLDVFKAESLPSSEADSAISMTNLYTAALPAPVEYLSIRSGGRFVTTQYAGGIQTYDIELNKQTLTAFKAPVNGELRWLDKYHFYLTTGSNLEVMEFDGGNPHVIAPLATMFDTTQSDDGKFIYSINSSESGFALQRSRMILE
ncbi:MAG: PEGA domain-containing protein [Patescibacteria group bacterium]